MMFSFGASAQIVTSKKEAQKKGTYSYNQQQKQTAQSAPSIDRTAVGKEMSNMQNGEVVAYEPNNREIKKGGPKFDELPAKKTNPSKGKKAAAIEDKPDPDFIPTPYESYFAQQVVNNAMQFEGVRYRGGGTTKDGMDCSGMVYATFMIFDMKLPRSSHEMAKAGTQIKLDEVKKGDLLFFANNRRRGINHVGLVTEVKPDGEVLFIHSSSSSGVIVSSMNEPYNSRTFVQAGRVIED